MNAMVEKRKGEDFVRDNITPQTNADNIRSFSDEELAEFMHNFNDCDCCLIEVCNEGTCGIGCTEGILQWLKSEVKE